MGSSQPPNHLFERLVTFEPNNRDFEVQKALKYFNTAMLLEDAYRINCQCEQSVQMTIHALYPDRDLEALIQREFRLNTFQQEQVSKDVRFKGAPLEYSHIQEINISKLMRDVHNEIGVVDDDIPTPIDTEEDFTDNELDWGNKDIEAQFIPQQPEPPKQQSKQQQPTMSIGQQFQNALAGQQIKQQQKQSTTIQQTRQPKQQITPAVQQHKSFKSDNSDSSLSKQSSSAQVKQEIDKISNIISNFEQSDNESLQVLSQVQLDIESLRSKIQSNISPSHKNLYEQFTPRYQHLLKEDSSSASSYKAPWTQSSTESKPISIKINLNNMKKQ